MPLQIHVANLPVDAKEDTVRKLFSRYGRVHSVYFSRAAGLPLTASSECFIEMHPGSSVGQAVSALDGQYFRGRLLLVEAVGPNSSV